MLYSKFVPKGSVTSNVPIGTRQVGWIVMDAVGEAGGLGIELMTTVPELLDTHPSELVTLKE